MKLTEKEFVETTLKMLREREWLTRHAAENQYCPSCSTDDDAWSDQTMHRPGCKFVELVTFLEDELKRL